MTWWVKSILCTYPLVMKFLISWYFAPNPYYNKTERTVLKGCAGKKKRKVLNRTKLNRTVNQRNKKIYKKRDRLVHSIEHDWTGLSMILQDMAIFERIWKYLAEFDRLWQDLTKFDKVWQDMAKFDMIQQGLTAFDSISQDLTRFDRIW